VKKKANEGGKEGTLHRSKGWPGEAGGGDFPFLPSIKTEEKTLLNTKIGDRKQGGGPAIVATNQKTTRINASAQRLHRVSSRSSCNRRIKEVGLALARDKGKSPTERIGAGMPAAGLPRLGVDGGG